MYTGQMGIKAATVTYGITKNHLGEVDRHYKFTDTRGYVTK
jgi:hypothetical protein